MARPTSWAVTTFSTATSPVSSVDAHQRGVDGVGEGKVHVAAGAQRLGLGRPIFVAQFWLAALVEHGLDRVGKGDGAED